MTSAQLKPTSDPVRQHVDMLHRLAEGVDGVLVVSAFNANLTSDKGTITHHLVGDVDGMVEAINAHRDTPGANVYCGLQVMRPSLARGQRGGERDIVAVLGLVADMDADTGHAAGEYPIAPNYVIKTSPGNLQPFWLFDEPVAPDAAKEIARGLKAATGSDHGTADIAHVWRVPGTWNWPSAKKLARGRSPDPVAVTVAAPWDGTMTSADALRHAVGAYALSSPQPVTLGDLPDVDGIEVTPEAAALLAATDVGDRSAHAARVVEKLAFDGHPAEAAAALFLSAAGDWLARYSSEERATADFQRLWAKYGAPHVDSRGNIGALAARVVTRVSGTSPVAANDNTQQVKKDSPAFPGVVSSGEFVRDFVPPDYHIDGIAQAAFFYSLTGMTGAGKTAVLLLIAYCTALGKRLGDRDVRKGRVIYSAGENPVDVRMRWLGMAHELGFDPENIDVHFVAGTYSIPECIDKIGEAAERIGGVDLVIIDTSAAYFQGDDENSNTQMGAHARDMRRLTELPGAPCVFAAAHPVKHASADNLLPKGGGSFLNEVDGNLTLAKSAGGAKMHWLGKHRGPDFTPLHFELSSITAPQLVDSKGRPIPTVMAKALTTGDARQQATVARRDEDDVLLEIDRDGSQSLSGIADALGWLKDGEAHKDRVRRACDKLKRDKLVEHKARKWKLTASGREAATDIRAERFRLQQAADGIAVMLSKKVVRDA